MKTLMITAAAGLLFAGAATAAEVQVIEKPGSNVRVIVTELTAPATYGVDGSGMMSADEVGMLGMDTPVFADVPPGFNPDVILNIWTDENGTRVEQIRR